MLREKYKAVWLNVGRRFSCSFVRFQWWVKAKIMRCTVVKAIVYSGRVHTWSVTLIGCSSEPDSFVYVTICTIQMSSVHGPCSAMWPPSFHQSRHPDIVSSQGLCDRYAWASFIKDVDSQFDVGWGISGPALWHVAFVIVVKASGVCIPIWVPDRTKTKCQTRIGWKTGDKRVQVRCITFPSNLSSDYVSFGNNG